MEITKLRNDFHIFKPPFCSLCSFGNLKFVAEYKNESGKCTKMRWKWKIGSILQIAQFSQFFPQFSPILFYWIEILEHQPFQNSEASCNFVAFEAFSSYSGFIRSRNSLVYPLVVKHVILGFSVFMLFIFLFNYNFSISLEAFALFEIFPWLYSREIKKIFKNFARCS